MNGSPKYRGEEGARSKNGDARSGPLRLIALVAVAALLAVLVAACGSSSSSSSSSESSGESSSESASAEGGGAIVEEAKKAVAEYEEEVTGGVPTSGPPAAKGKSVILIPCSAAAAGCSEPMEGAAEAAKLLGWSTRTIDGKGTPADEENAIQQAIALKPDAIIIHAIEPETVTGAVKDAEAAGIPVISSSTAETDLIADSSNPPRQIWVETGEQAAAFLIAQTEGKAKFVRIINEEFSGVLARQEGFDNWMSKCEAEAECEELAGSSFAFAEMAQKLPQVTQQLLQANPDAEAIVVPFDAAVPFVIQGEEAIGKELLVTGGDATAEALKCIREECGLTATGAVPVKWIGWTDIDAANRIFNNTDPKPASEGMPTKLITKNNVQEEEGTWNGDVDYPKLYEELWGIGG